MKIYQVINLAIEYNNLKKPLFKKKRFFKINHNKIYFTVVLIKNKKAKND